MFLFLFAIKIFFQVILFHVTITLNEYYGYEFTGFH